MMSTALVMVAGGEQTKVRAATSVRVESGEITFAQSFGERVDLSTDVQTMNSTGDASNGMREGKSSGLVKNSDAPSDASSGVKPNGIVDQRIMGGNETKSVAVTLADSADKNVIVETNLVALANASGRGKSITTPGQPLSNGGVLQQDTAAKIVPQTGLSQTKTTEAAEAIGSEELPAGNVKEVAEASSSVSEELPLAASTNVDAVPRESTALADRSLLSRDAIEPTDQNEKVLAGKTVDVASAKRDAKPQESAVVAKAASKTTGMTESAKADGDALLGTAVQGAIPLPTQEAATSDGQRNADSVTAANVTGLSGVIPGKLAAAAVSPTDGTNRKVIPKVEKSEVEVTGQSAIPPTGTTAATGFGAEIAQAVMVASTAEKDADPKGLSAVGVAASVHGVAGSEGAVSGIVAGMMSGHTPAEVSETKAQAGEAGVHSATSQAGLTEQDGFGAAASEMGMAHRTLLATPMALEVGVSNGTQGWLKIRAEMTDGGVVNASLSSASSAGQEMLHRELPALTAYLQEERVGVNTVIVPSTAAAGTDSRFAGGMDREGGGQSQQGSSQGGTDDGQRLIRGSTADEIPMYMALNGVGEDGLLSPGPYAGGGSWLNVRA